MSIETKPQRRELRFLTLEQAVQDAESLLATGYSKLGNWNLGQCCGHLADWLTYPIDGFPKTPLLLRPVFWTLRNTIATRLMQKTLASGQMKPGIATIPASVHEPSVDDATQLARFRQAVERWKNYNGPLKPSPIFGRVDHETWTGCSQDPLWATFELFDTESRLRIRALTYPARH